MATIQVRVSDEDKAAVEKILKSLGLDLTTAVRVYLKRIKIDGGIPFPLNPRLTVNGFTPEFESEILRAEKEDDVSPAFDTAEEAIEFLHSQVNSKDV
ncbi:type II toxin-antitoxin system RelB/DinJ family antitoxin [Patescibacteria group bacterium]|nr:type II toxin-antitoxin system RelB/DinJ family antitoxin [Patescibacteria group bacterium]MBU2259267.1 type II toxin-antitoxin system RelB/DinJ family antitoxin [Patescibacteria group bacterium]